MEHCFVGLSFAIDFGLITLFIGKWFAHSQRSVCSMNCASGSYDRSFPITLGHQLFYSTFRNCLEITQVNFSFLKFIIETSSDSECSQIDNHHFLAFWLLVIWVSNVCWLSSSHYHRGFEVS
jgi:hypothetical protein